MKELLSNIWQHPRTSVMGLLIGISTIAGVMDQQGVTLGHAGTGTVIALIGGIAAALLGLVAKDPIMTLARMPGKLSKQSAALSEAIKADDQQRDAQQAETGSRPTRAMFPALAMVALTLVVFAAGCTGSQVNDAVSKIAAYLPTAISLTNEALTIYAAVGSSSSDNSSTPYNALSAVRSDLTALQKPISEYLAASTAQDKATTWTNVQALIDTAVSDSDSLLAVAAVKNSQVQQQGVIVIASIDAAVHVLDACVSSTQTVAQVQAKAAKRAIKLDTISRYWSPGDKREMSRALGMPYSLALRQAEAAGF